MALGTICTYIYMYLSLKKKTILDHKYTYQEKAHFLHFIIQYDEQSIYV